jgi:uncharacterized protein (TIGR00730 family)
MIRTVTVFCGSSNDAPMEYLDLAGNVGKLIADNNLKLVYGGGSRGLMGAVARAYLANGGDETTGITIPRWHNSDDYELAHVVTVVENIEQRKHMLFETGDAFIVLPGSFGTMDEICCVMAEAQYSTHDKPIICVTDFFKPIQILIENMIATKLAPEDLREKITFVDTPEEIFFLKGSNNV